MNSQKLYSTPQRHTFNDALITTITPIITSQQNVTNLIEYPVSDTSEKSENTCHITRYQDHFKKSENNI